MNTSFYRKVFLFVTTLIISFPVFGNNGKKIIPKRKADFILQISSMISFPNSPKSNTYKIGIYGRGSEIRSLLNEFESRGENLKINGKKIEVYSFKTTRTIVPVDLLYVSGNSKIRISELNKKLAKHPYIMLTENFPFGTSMLNFTVDKKEDIFFELQEEVIKRKGAKVKSGLLNAKNRITTEKEWKQVLDTAVAVIKNQKQTIEEKSHEILENKKVIRAQRITIIVSILAILIISGLGFVLYKINQHRKEILNNLYDSINYSTHIQKSILPSKSLFKQHFNDFFILYEPKSLVSGDFYWLDSKQDKIFFAVADCTGHGVPGAMLSIMCSQSLTRTLKELDDPQPSTILDKVSYYLEDYFSKSKYDINDGMDLALCMLNLKNKKLEFAGAKCPLYLLQDDELKVIKSDRHSIGGSMEKKNYTNHEIDFKEGDRIYLFSDGYPDQFGGPNDKKFSYKRFREALITIQDKPMIKQKEILSTQITEWMNGYDQTDDISVLGVKL